MPEETELSLKEEYDFFLSKKSELLEENRGRFALVKGKEIVGIFDSDEDAYKMGLERIGNEPFLIVRIQEEQDRTWIPVLDLGLLGAHS